MARKDGKDRGLFQRRGQPAWWIRWHCNHGHEHQEKVGPKGLAKTLYLQRRVAVKTEDFCLTQARQAKPVGFATVMERYLIWAAQQRPRSVTFRAKALKHLQAAFGAKALSAIAPASIEAYQARRRDAGAAPGTVNRERSVLSHLFTKAITWGVVQTNPVTKTEPLVEADEHPRPLTADEEARLLLALPRGKRGWPYWHTLVLLDLHTGLRLNELRQQAWRDIDLTTGELTVTQPKSGKPETLPLNATARRVLASLPQTSPLVFPTLPKKVSDVFAKFVAKAKLPDDITFHCLRDTFISRLAPHVSGPTLMRLARHRDYRTTRRYVRVDGDHLRAAVTQLDGAGTVTETVTTESSVSQPPDSAGETPRVE